MGGIIFVGLRFKDKNGNPKEVLMNRWTNDLPWRSLMPSFIDQGEEFEEFISEAVPSDDPYENTQLVTEVQQSEYGVTLFDFIQHKIFSYGHYYDPGRNLVTANSTAFEYELPGIIEVIRRGYVDEIRDLDWNVIYKDNPEYPRGREKFIKRIRFDIVNNRRREIFYDIHLSKDRFPFKIEKGHDVPTYNRVKNWMKRNGWISPVNKESFQQEEE
jgi:hypothetical protein